VARYAHVTGWGMAVPERVLTNAELTRMVDTSHEWIVSRTGIHERRIAAKGETTASLAARAGQAALDRTEVQARDLQLVIVATCTPDHLFPATACLVQDRLGAIRAGAFDLSAACSGFIFALQMAAQSIRSGAIDNALVIGAETLSRFTNWEDRGTCVLFGDAAGAFVLQAGERPGGVLACVMRSDGSGGDLLSLPAGGSKLPATSETIARKQHTIHMNGREVFRFAARAMTSATREASQRAGWRIEDVDLVVPHQANLRIIETAARALRLSSDRMMVNIERYGNTSAASIPVAICEAFEQGRIRPDDRLVLVAFGAGLTWGALALQWVTPERPLSGTDRRRRRILAVFARLRSLARRVVRYLEGLMWGTHHDPD
jgi:3-oxoacyl-[acyl-carrier-protein] synthase-3